MSFVHLDDPDAPPPPPWGAVSAEVERRRARRRNVCVAGSGATVIAFLAVVALAGWPSSKAPVQVALRPEPTTTMVPATPPPHPEIVPSVGLSPATGSAIAVGGSASSAANTGDSAAAPPCVAAGLTLTTEVTAADILQGVIVRLHLVNVSGRPCTLVTDPCVDSSYTIATPQGTSASMSRTCGFPPTARLLPPGGEFGADDIWPPPTGVTPGQYVARGSWRVGDQVVTGTTAPFTL